MKQPAAADLVEGGLVGYVSSHVSTAAPAISTWQLASFSAVGSTLKLTAWAGSVAGGPKPLSTLCGGVVGTGIAGLEGIELFAKRILPGFPSASTRRIEEATHSPKATVNFLWVDSSSVFACARSSSTVASLCSFADSLVCAATRVASWSR